MLKGSRVGFGVIGILNPTTATLPATTTNMAVYGGTSSIAVCHLVPIANSGVTGTVYFQVSFESKFRILRLN